MFLSGGKKGSQGQGFKIIGEKNQDTINMLVIYICLPTKEVPDL
jgi:hypothetical protein